MTDSAATEELTQTARHSLKSLVRHSSVYSVVPLVQRAVSVLLVPVYTAPDVLRTSEYGVLEMTDLLIVAIAQLVGVNLLGGMTRFYFDQKDPADRPAVVTSATLAMSAMAWLAVGLALAFRGPLTSVLFDASDPELGHVDLTQALVLALLIIPFSLSTACGFEYLKIGQRSGLFAGLQLGKLALEVSLKVWMLLGLDMGVSGLLLSTLIGEIVATTLLTGTILVRLGPRVRWSVLRPMVAFTLPLIPVGLCQLGLHQLDRYLLKELGPPSGAMHAVGLYGLGYKVSYLVNAVMLGSFLQIWHPWVYGVKDPSRRALYVARVSTYAVLAIAAGSLIVVLFGRQAVQLLAGQESYYPAYRVVPWVTTGYVFWALYNVSQIPLFIAKRTLPLLWINLAALACNVWLNVLLVPRLGFVGPAYATLGTFAFLAALGILASRREAEVPFQVRRLVTVLAVVLAAAVLSTLVDGRGASAWSLTESLLPKAGLLVAAWLVLGATALDRGERRELRAWIGGWLRARRGPGSRD